jgi:hypothetical protein
MNTTSSPRDLVLPSTSDFVKPAIPEVDPLREAKEVAEAIRGDCRLQPDEYLEEVWVPGGGE